MSGRVRWSSRRGSDKPTPDEAQEATPDGVQQAAAGGVLPGTRDPATGDAGPGFGALLRPDRETVTFTGRAAELGELRAWCASEPARTVRILYGDAGVGKTRLALEIAAEHKAAGGEWRLVAAGQEAGAVAAARASTTGPLLLVVDQAEARAGLDELLRAVPEDPGPVRVLLIARALGEWWDRLISASEPAAARLLTEAAPLRLAARLSEDASDTDLARAALTYFARALSIAVPEQVTVEPAARPMPVLVLHAAALVALLRSYPFPASSVRVIISGDTLQELLEHEARGWQRAASAAWLPAGAATIKQVIAAACLLGPANAEEAAEAVGRVPDLTDAPGEERLLWARWLEHLYPAAAGRRFNGLQPDMVAETHVVGQLVADPDLARSCLRGLSAEHAEHALRMLARACAHQDRAQELIAAALHDDLACLGIPASHVALQDKGDLGGLLAEALDDAPAPARVLTDIARKMPYPSTVLARAHLAAIDRVRQFLPADAEPEMTAEWDARAARLRSELGRDAGQPARQTASPQQPASEATSAADGRDPRSTPAGLAAEPAASGAQTATPTPRASPATTPAAPARPADPRTADQETNPARRAPAVSPATAATEPAASASPAAAPATPARPADPRTADQETNPTRRAPAVSPTSPATTPATSPAAEPAESGRAAAEPARSGLPGKRDRGADTHQSSGKAGKRRRAASRADRKRARPGPRGAAANTTGVSAKRVSAAAEPPQPSRPEDPATEYLETVAAYRELATTNPGRYRADLATALINLGLRLAELGRPDEALKAGLEALAIRRQLDETDPDRFRAELATCLVSLGIWYSELGRTDEALKVEQEAVSIRRELVAIDPARYRPDLAASLANLGITLSELDRPATALGPVREAVTIYRDLARTDSRRYRPDLARCLANLGIRYAGLNRPAEALPPSEEAVTIRRELARVNPDRHRPDLARSLVSLGFRYSELGRATDAVPPGREAVSIYRQLAVASPDYRRELARALSGVAAALDVLGRDAEAERAEGEAAEIMQDLEQSAPAVLG
jgi:tetratricopeptide (TPR) repeat protein